MSAIAKHVMTDSKGRHYQLLCPFCGAVAWSCPDPACRGKSHCSDWCEPSEACYHGDIPTNECGKRYLEE